MKNKKNFLKKLSAVALGFVMTLGVGAAGYSASARDAKAATGDTYTKITSNSEIQDGDYIIFVKSDGLYACSITQNKNNRASVGITSSSDSYTKKANDNVQEFKVIAGATAGQFGFHTGSGYIYSAASSDNKINTNSTAESTKPTGTSLWTIGTDMSVTNVSNTNYYLAFNGTTIFSQYKSGQSKTTIYKKASGTVDPAVNSVTLDKNAINGYVGSTPVTLTATVSAVGGASTTVNWTVVNANPTNCVSVTNAGVVSFNAVGTATVKATSTADNSKYDTCAVTVKPDPVEKTFAKITSTSDIESGKQYLIVCETKNDALDGSEVYNGSETFSVSISSSQIVASETKSFTISSSSTSYKITGFNAGTIGHQSGSSNTLSTNDSYTNTITFDTSGNVKIQTDSRILSRNSQNAYYRYYSSVQTNIQLYKECEMYTVSYNQNTGTGNVASQQVIKGKSVTLASSGFSKTGNTLDGWATSASGNAVYNLGATITPTSDLSLFAHWTPTKYTVSYNGNGSTSGSVASTQHSYGISSALSSDTFIRTGYTQDGWATTSSGAKQYELGGQYTIGADNVTLYAHWVATTSTISFDANTGSGGPSSTVTATYDSAMPSISDLPTKEGYDFAGYYDATTGGNQYYTSAGASAKKWNKTDSAITLYAHWSIKSYTVTYDAGEGTPSASSLPVEYDSYVDLEVTATRTQYTFIGWSDVDGGDTPLTSLKMPAYNITLYAIWQKDQATYTFTAHANNGSTDSSSQTFHNGDPLTVPAITYQNEGYDAIGWAISADATSAQYQANETIVGSDSNIDIYVVWKKHLATNPTLSLENDDSMYVNDTQNLTITYTPGAQTLSVSSSSETISLTLISNDTTTGVAVYQIKADSAGAAIITAGDSHYSSQQTITSKVDTLVSIEISGELPEAVYYEGHTLSIEDAVSELSIIGVMDSSKRVEVDSSKVEWLFSNDSDEIELDCDMESVFVKAIYDETLTSDDLELAIDVTEVVLSRIEATHNSTNHYIGEGLDKEHLTVHAYYNDGTALRDGSENLINIADDCEYIYDNSAFLVAGTSTITADYNGITDDFNVTVIAKSYPPTVTWTRVTTVAELLAGGTFIIGYESSAKSGTIVPMANSGTATTSTAGYMYSGSTAAYDDSSTITISTNAVKDSEGNDVDTSAFEVNIGESNSIENQIFIQTTDGYIGNENTKNNCKLFDDQSEHTTFKPTISDTDNNVFELEIEANTGNTDNYKYFRYNTTNPRFAVYKSGQKDVVIYQKTTNQDDPDFVGISAVLANPSKEYTVGEPLTTSDFVVTAHYDDGTTNAYTNYTISGALSGTKNTITLISSDDSNIRCTIVVNAVNKGEATGISLSVGSDIVDTYYIDVDEDKNWDLTNINVVVSYDTGETIDVPLSQLVSSKDMTLTHAKPQVGDTSFSVTGKYLGFNLSDTVSGLNVYKTKVTGYSNWTLSTKTGGFMFDVYDGSSFDFDRLGAINVTWNDARKNDDNKDYSRSNISYLLENGYAKLYLSSVNKEKLSDSEIENLVEITSDFKWSSTYNNYYMYIVSNIEETPTFTRKTTPFKVVDVLNPITHNDTTTLTFNSTNFALSDSASDGSKTVNGITFDYSGAYIYNSCIALAKGSNDNQQYIDSTTPIEGIKKITFYKGGSSMGSSTLFAKTAGGTSWDNLGTISVSSGNSKVFEFDQSKNYVYFSITNTNNSFTNIGSFEVEIENSGSYANEDVTAQGYALDFARYFISNYETESWVNIKSQYANLITNNNKLSADQKTLIGNMFKYANHSDESLDVLQQCVEKYDQIVYLNSSYENFLDRTLDVTFTVTVDKKDGSDPIVAKVKAGQSYVLPAAPTGDGVFLYWDVNGEQKQPGSSITVTNNIEIFAVYEIKELNIEASVGFKFTGLNMEKFQLVFNVIVPDDAETYGFMYTTTDGLDLRKQNLTAVLNDEVSAVRHKENTNRLSLNTADANKEATAIFYWIDEDENVYYSNPMTISFNGYIQSSSFSIDSITDQYARAALEAHLRSLKDNENQGE